MSVFGGGTTVEAGLRALTNGGGRGHLSAGVAEHPVVEHQARDRLAPRRRVQHLGKTFRHHVAVALEGVDGPVREHPLHAGGDGRRATVQALQELDIGGGDDLRVTPVTDDADRTVDQFQFREHLDEQSPCDRMSAAPTEMVLGALQQIRRELRNLPRSREIDLAHRDSLTAMAARMRSRMMSTSSRSPWRMPDSSWLTPAIECTGTAPFTASRTSSTICPALSS